MNADRKSMGHLLAGLLRVNLVVGMVLALAFSILGVTPAYAWSGAGHFVMESIGYTDGTHARAYTAAPNFRQAATSLGQANSLISDADAVDVYVNFDYDTLNKNVRVAYTTDGSAPSKTNGTVVDAAFSKYADPNRTWYATIPAQPDGTTVNYVFYISDSDLASAWGRISGTATDRGVSQYQTSWGEGDAAYFSYVVGYTVSYNANGATGGTAPGNQTKTHDVALTLATNSGNLARTGYTFTGWNTQANGLGTHYDAAGTYTANAAVTLYAQWNQVVVPGMGGGPGPGGVGIIDGSSSLALWLRPDRGVYANTGCTTAATNGQDVACWRDQSGNVRSYTQSTIANQPNYYTGARNGQPVIRFNGSTDGLTNPGPAGAVLAAGDDTFTYFASWMSNVFNWKVIYEQNHTSVLQGTRASLITTYSNNYGFNGESNDYHHAAPYTIGQYQVSSIVLNGSSSNNVVVTGNGTSYTGSINITTQNVGVDGGTAVGYKITTPGEFFNGDIPEVIVFSDTLPDVERILVENYLSAKYDVALTANDVYNGDTAGNGDFDLDMAGIGRFGGNNHTQAYSAGIIVVNRTFLQDNGDWLTFGHRTASNNKVATDLPTGGGWGADSRRWARHWYFDRTETTVNDGMVDIIFDFSEGNMNGGQPPAGPASNYRLLRRADGVSQFSDIATASAIVGDQVQFLGVDVSLLGSNFTLGTLDDDTSPLTVVLADFTATAVGNHNVVAWETVSELRNLGFGVGALLVLSIGAAIVIRRRRIKSQ